MEQLQDLQTRYIAELMRSVLTPSSNEQLLMMRL